MTARLLTAALLHLSRFPICCYITVFGGLMATLLAYPPEEVEGMLVRGLDALKFLMP